MSSFASLFRMFTSKQPIRQSQILLKGINRQWRCYGDASSVENQNSKPVVVQGNESEERVRVRRARPADVPRVLRFVREHSKTAWPGLAVPSSVSHIVLCDYVARALAQGHSMLAEQPEPRRGWSEIRGLALSTSVCPWDATMLEKWSRCVRCTRSRRLMHFTAHCLRAPALHDKYRVHNILQVILVVPPDTQKSSEIIQVLAKNAIHRGKDIGFPIVRFDVTDETVAKALEALQLKKEWQLTYDFEPLAHKVKTAKSQEKTPIVEISHAKLAASNVNAKDSKTPATDGPEEPTTDAPTSAAEENKPKSNGNFVAVYTAFTHTYKDS